MPYFASFGGSSLGFYTPQDMMEALLHYRGPATDARAERARLLAVSGCRQQDESRPPAAAPPQRMADGGRADDGAQPVDLSLGGKSLPAKPAPLSGAQDILIGTLVGHLQDAVMAGLGLMREDVRPSAPKAAVVRPVFGGRAVFYAHGYEVFVVCAAYSM